MIRSIMGVPEWEARLGNSKMYQTSPTSRDPSSHKPQILILAKAGRLFFGARTNEAMLAPRLHHPTREVQERFVRDLVNPGGTQPYSGAGSLWRRLIMRDIISRVCCLWSDGVQGLMRTQLEAESVYCSV